MSRINSTWEIFPIPGGAETLLINRKRGAAKSGELEFHGYSICRVVTIIDR